MKYSINGNLNLKTFRSFEGFRRAIVDGVLTWKCSVTLLNTTLAEPWKGDLSALYRLHSGKGKHKAVSFFFVEKWKNACFLLVNYYRMFVTVRFTVSVTLFRLSGVRQVSNQLICPYNHYTFLIRTLITFEKEKKLQFNCTSRLSLRDEIFHHTRMCLPYTYSYSMGEM